MSAAVSMTLEQLSQSVSSMAADLARVSFEKPLKICRMLIAADTKDNFAGGHDPDRNPWAPLNSPRARRKGQRGGSDKPLRDRGILQSASTSGAQAEITPTSLTYRVSAGNVLEYAGTHQYGAVISKPERRRSKPWVFRTGGGDLVFTRRIRAHTIVVPQRQFLGIGARLQARIEGVLAEFVASQIHFA